ncbi:F-box protein At3g07870-like [Magnolia sinica]|uniref:F-box protein At3g07870-like n=1 Tax=Magnolia sinica TaxID=86752 RepID=UPI00265AF29F|nr:F-box protein At3g07870-like [Magnolia sinica]XP_058083402.1 F-box protein At3g07870-like [Magnolia sinica]XP_058083403.1 F-box protein At3g07870-like [Magnolia sinica]XP_058083404.1 F-box protein At3g07870-like [Magnolia sinica]
MGRGEMQHLPTDIIINILSRLPVKTLSRLRCVSPLWRTLISTPHFLSTHHDRAAEQPSSLFSTRGQYQRDGSFIIHISSVDHKGTVQKTFTKKVSSVVHSLQSYASLACLIGTGHIYICNPSTEEFITLPQASRGAFHGMDGVGFGYSSSAKQYKVVHLFYSYSGHEIADDQVECEVFTLGCEESSWKRIKNCPYHVYFNPPPFVEGSLHWVIHDYYHNSYDEVILSFDLDREEFRVIPHPECCSTPDYYRSLLRLVELRGCLCVVKPTQPSKHSIWMLKDYKNGTWVKEYNLDLAPLGSYDMFPRAIRSDGAILMEMPRKRLDYYDPGSGTFTKFNRIEVEGGFLFSYYVESFYSLGST